MGISCVYVTAPGKKVAETIAKTVVDERLASCVNVFDGVTSFFHWNDQTDMAQELVLVIKTSDKTLEALMAKVKSLHPYECPCIVSWSIEKGWSGFIEWTEQTCMSSN